MIRRPVRLVRPNVRRTQANQRLADRALPVPSKLAQSIRQALNPALALKPETWSHGDRSLLAATGRSLGLDVRPSSEERPVTPADVRSALTTAKEKFDAQSGPHFDAEGYLNGGTNEFDNAEFFYQLPFGMTEDVGDWKQDFDRDPLTTKQISQSWKDPVLFANGRFILFRGHIFAEGLARRSAWMWNSRTESTHQEPTNMRRVALSQPYIKVGHGTEVSTEAVGDGGSGVFADLIAQSLGEAPSLRLYRGCSAAEGATLKWLSQNLGHREEQPYSEADLSALRAAAAKGGPDDGYGQSLTATLDNVSYVGKTRGELFDFIADDLGGVYNALFTSNSLRAAETFRDERPGSVIASFDLPVELLRYHAKKGGTFIGVEGNNSHSGYLEFGFAEPEGGGRQTAKRDLISSLVGEPG